VKAIPVGIIEPQRLFAPFLIQTLSEAGFSVVTSLESLAIDEIGRNEPAVVFVDIDFIDVDPMAALRQLRTVVPDATICAYTGNSDEAWVAACTRAGANCVISKSATPAEIANGIQRAMRVGAFVDSRFGNAAVVDEANDQPAVDDK
jgi:DNA-binding NarL/FixJ family response regulator